MQKSATLSDRQTAIMRHIEERGFATIDAMAKIFAVSAQTVRRDLIHLERQSYLQRFHGGAGLSGNVFRVGHAQKIATSPEGKQRIAALVAARIPAGASVYLDVGSTMEVISRQLCAHSRLHVVTASARVAMIFADFHRIDVFVTGGMMRSASGALTGHHALSALRNLRFDYAISSFGGFDADGNPTDFDVDKIAMRQLAFAQATHRIGVVDASKFNKVAMRPVLGDAALTELIVDAAPPQHVVSAMNRMGTRIAIASDAGACDHVV